MRCLILAGGLGTRLASAHPTTPKHLVPVNGVPFADYQLRWLREGGVTDVVYSIGHLGAQIRDFVGDGSRYGLKATYVDEGDDLRGTGGAIRLAFDTGRLPGDFYVLYGDALLQLDLRAVHRAFLRAGKPALMTVYRNQGRFDRSNAVFDGELVRYDKHHPEPDMEWIDYGLSVLAPTAVERIPPHGVHDIADAFHALGEEQQLAGYEVRDRFFELGTPESLRELEEQIRYQQEPPW